MANFIYITLDTTAPANPTISIAGGSMFATAQLATLTVSVADANTTDYQMKIWGDVDETYDTNIKKTEALSGWIPYSTSPQIKLSAVDGTKQISLRVRDDVHNSSSIVIDDIKLDTNIPTVTVTNPDVAKISKIAGKDTFSFNFSVSEGFTEYKVKLVGSIGATQDTGVQIPTTNGSQNTSGVGTFTSESVVTVTVKGLDLELAGATSDGQKIIKVFVKDSVGLWSA